VIPEWLAWRALKRLTLTRFWHRGSQNILSGRVTKKTFLHIGFAQFFSLYVTQTRASFLLGIPEAELSRISKESGLGHVERAENEEETYCTYEELQRICLLAAR